MKDQGLGSARSLSTWRWGAFATCVVAAPLIAIVTTGHTLVWGDTARLFAPVRTLVVEALRAGRLPLWNPYEGLGAPLLAQQLHGVLHPASIIAALIAPSAGMDLLVIAHVTLAALGAFVLARELGSRPDAAAVAALAYGLSGYVLSTSYVIQYQSAAGVAPWTIAALHAAARGARRGLPLAAVAVAVQLFAGDPQWFIVAAALGAAVAWAGCGVAGLVRVVAAGLLGTAIGAVQLLPALAYLRDADRSAGLTPADRVQWALAPARLLELVLPGFFHGRPGLPEAPVFRWLGGPSAYATPFIPSVFVGVGVLWLAVHGARASRSTRALAVAAGVLVWIALGTALGATQLLGRVPVWGAFRYSEKLAGPLTLCLAVLAAMGVARLDTGGRTVRTAVAIAATCAALGAAFWGWTGAEDLLRDVGAAAAAPEARHRLAVGFGQAAMAAALFAAALAISSRRGDRWRAPAFSAAVALASMAALPLGVHVGVRQERDDSLMAAIRASDPLARIATPVPAGYGPGNLDHWDRVEWAEARMGLPSHSVAARVCNVDAYSGILPLRYMLVAGAFGERFGPQSYVASRRIGVSHVVLGPTWEPRAAERAQASIAGGTLLVEDPAWRMSVWQVPHRPWASFAPGAVAARDVLDAHRALVDLVAEGRPEVVLESPPPAAFAPGEVLSASRAAASVRIDATSAGPGLLVVNEGWAPGWRATLDGAPIAVEPADVVARAVRWPGGRHVLEMRYDPPEVRLGAWITLAGLVAALLLAARGRRASKA